MKINSFRFIFNIIWEKLKLWSFLAKRIRNLKTLRLIFIIWSLAVKLHHSRFLGIFLCKGLLVFFLVQIWCCYRTTTTFNVFRCVFFLDQQIEICTQSIIIKWNEKKAWFPRYGNSLNVRPASVFSLYQVKALSTVFFWDCSSSWYSDWVENICRHKS